MLKQIIQRLYGHLAAMAFTLFIASTQLATAGDLVPYRGGAEGYVVSREDLNGGVAIPFGPPFRRVTSEAVGNFTHVGRSTLALVYDVTLIIQDGVPYLVGDGYYVLTAANGDTLSGPLHNVQNYFTGEFTIESAITEGTGRFEGATGTLGGFGLYSIQTDTFEYVLEGSITSVGSLKKK